MFAQVIINKYYYQANDSFYYYSIAQNLHENGIFADATADPYGPIITPQNGIVAVFWILQSFPLSPETIYILIACLNYLLMCLALYPLFKIAESLELKNSFIKISLAALLLCNLTYAENQAYPLNDSIFRTGALWLIYFFSICNKKFYSQDKVTHWKIKCTAGFLFSIVLIHFRLETILLVSSFALAALLIRKFKLFAFTCIFLIAMILSLMSLYLFSTYSEVANPVHTRLIITLPHLFGNMYNIIFRYIPIALYKDLGHRSNLLYLPFYLSALLALITGFRKKNFELLSLPLILSSIFALFVLSNWGFAPRYFLNIMPLFYLLLFTREKLRIVGYLFVFTIVASSAWFFYDGFNPTPKVQFWTYVSKNIKLRKDNTLMFSYPSRPAWFFTGATVFTQYNAKFGRSYNCPFEKMVEADNFYLAGDKKFVDGQKDRILKLAKQNSYKVDSELLTSEYIDHVGHGIHQIKLTPVHFK